MYINALDEMRAAEQAELHAQSAEFCGEAGRVTERAPPAGGGTRGRYHIKTFGCQMNMADSERMAGVLETMGYACAAEADDADVVVYNTCSIRDKAEQKVYAAMGKQAKRKRAKGGSDLKIVVAGCVAGQEGERLLRRVPEIDLVMGPHHANRIDSLLDQVDQGSQVCATDEIHITEDYTQPRRESDISAWVNIIYGCNERCTYCVVPQARGLEQSREPDAIKREVWALGEAGYKEVTLLGQNIDAYGRDLGGLSPDGSRRRWTFTDLLYHIAGAPGIERIRFATSHPRYFSPRLIEALHELPQVVEHFHIPHQSGDDKVLQEMSRGYKVDRYRGIIANIRELMPKACISTDIIVGFPGETEEEYQRSEDLVREIGFDRCNTAAYSPRPNTPAALREDQVAELVKMDRLNRLNRVAMEVAEERAQRFVGDTLSVLVEGPNPKLDGQVMGRTEGNKIAFFEGVPEDRGTIVYAKVTRATASALYCDRVSALPSTSRSR